MNSKSEECSTDNNNDNNINTSNQQNKPNLDSEGTPTSSSSSLSSGETSSLANIDQTGGCPSSGANSNWSYAQSGQYQQQQPQQQDQQQYYPQYQYSQQQQQPYNEQNYYQESDSKNLYYQDQQYFNQNSYQYPEQQQQQEGAKQVHPDQHLQEQQQGQQEQEQGNQEEQTAHDQTGETQAPRQQNPRVDQNTSRETGKCWECGAAFQDDELLRDHLVLFHAEIPAHKCHSCPAVFPSQSTLTLHITTSHLVGASIQSASRVQRAGNLTQEEDEDEDEFDEEEEEEEEDDDEEEEDSDQEDYLKGIVSSGASISVSGSGGSSLSSLLAKGISVSGGDSSVASSLQAKGISVSGGDSSVKSSLQAKGVLVSGSNSSLAETLPTKSISVSGGSDSSLSSLLAKGISVSGGDSPLKALQGKGISISGGNSSVTSLQSKGISISGGDSSLSFLQAKGISISSAESQQTKGASVSDQDSSLSYLQAKGISISGAESSLQAKGVSVSGGGDSLSFLQAKGISVSGAESSLESKGTSVSGGDSSLSALLAKGISVSGGDSSLQGKSAPQSSAEDQLSSLQAKGITLSPAKSQLSSLQTKGISVSAANSPLSLLQGKGVSLSAANPQLSSLQAKGISFSTPSNQVPSLEGKGVSLSAPNSQLTSLQAKGVSLSPANSQLASLQDNEASPSASEVSPSASEASPLANEASPSARETSPSAPDSQLSSLHAKGVSLSAATSQVASDQAKGPSRRPAKPLVKYRQAKGTVAFQKTKETTASVSKPKESPLRRKEYFGCVYCRIKQFKSVGEFEKHHQNHVKQTKLKVILLQVNPEDYRRNAVDTRRKKRSAGLKLKLKISKVGRGRGRKRREVRIVSNEGGMSESHKSSEERAGLEAEHQEEEEGEGEATASNNLAGEEEQSEGELGEESSRHSTDLNNESTENQEEYPSSGHDIPNDQQQEYQQEEQGSEQGNFEQQKDQEEEEVSAPPQQEETQGAYQTRSAADQGSNSNSGFDTNFSEQDLGFGAAGPSEAPPSTYQPQFESFPTSDWFSEYESGSRIAAAMAGATTAETASEGGWAGGSDAATNPAYTTANTSVEKDGQGAPVNGGENQVGGEDGLFSQAVLGQESPDKNDRQGSFEQLCLNDAYSGQAQNDRDGQSEQVQGVLSEEQQEHQQQSGVASDLLSELEYLNNSGQPPPGSQPGQIEGSPHSGGPSPHSGGAGTPSHLSSRGSNSGTPTSSGGHPTPPPSDTSFRALATSPMTSPTQPTSPLLPGQTPPATSPLQQSSDQQPGVPRLTIANNLMAPTTSSQITPTTNNNQAGVGGMMSRYGSQWPQAPGYTGTSGYGSLGGTSMANSNMAGTLRAPLPPSVGMPYRPSPPARVRGRPPLMGQIGRPPLHQGSLLQPSRGPGRPPTSSILPPPLMPAPGGRGSMMPPLQRMHQGMYQGQRQSGPQQQNGAAKRPLLGAAGHSPSKNARREDINVPSRQKDNECQIIAVANRSDGLPVIANVQGGSGSNQRGGSTTPTTSESTINLSDSITLSVRSNAADKPPQRGERGGGDAGTVANLLASRGITVTPAAGERQDGAGGGRDDRRLPTAQELNLSSAISVHPPTQREREASAAGRERDRDGFAVPQAPVRSSSSSSNSNNVERPPRPPTVDLTQDIPVAGSQGTRHPCSQCDRTFPTASLLADHARVHQQSQQTRMPFKCHLCTAGFSTQKGQQHHYQQFHQLHLSAGDIAIPLVDLRNPVNVQRMAALGIRSFLPLTNLQNRGAGGVVGIPVLTLENLRNGHMTLQQWGVSDVLSLGPAKTLSMPR